MHTSSQGSKRKSLAVVVVALLLAVGIVEPEEAAAAESGQASLLAVQLKTEHLVEPIGVERAHPRFRWELRSDERGQVQTAYQVLVAGSLSALQAGKGDKWDSGKVTSDNSVEVPYQGSELSSGERCYWKIRVWDREAKAGAYSEPSFFEMGLRKPADWQGQWIAARKGISAPLFRRQIGLNGSVRKARVYVSGIGYYELYINGKRIGDRVLEPAPTYYNNDQPFKLNTRVLYGAYDITSYLRSGANAFGVMLGNGWYSAENDVAPSPEGRTPYGDHPRLLLQANIELENGSHVTLVSDSHWKTSPGPIVYNDLFHGETYDARLEKSGWNDVNADESSWEPASVAEAPSGVLTAELLPPSRVMETLPAQKLIIPREPEAFDNTYVYDFGQTFSGWVRITVSGPAGAKVVLKYGSRIYPEDDTLDNRSNMTTGIRSPAGRYLHPERSGCRNLGAAIYSARFSLRGGTRISRCSLGGKNRGPLRALRARASRVFRQFEQSPQSDSPQHSVDFHEQLPGPAAGCSRSCRTSGLAGRSRFRG